MSRRVLLLGLLAFVIALLVVLPASWVLPLLPENLRCESPGGSLWRGQCGALTIAMPNAAPQRLQALRWRLAPMALLRLKLRAQVQLTAGDVQVAGTVELGRGQNLKLQQLQASGTLDRRVLAALPAGWSARFQASDVELDLRGNELLRMQGKLSVQDLHDTSGTRFGDYQLIFAPVDAPPFAGTLRDTGGPLSIDARITVQADRSWLLDGNVTAKPGSDPALYRQLDIVGPADLSGRRPIRLEGSFTSR
jgi:hypothetical protein